MDRFTRRYLMTLGVFLMVGVGGYVATRDRQVSRLNRVLRGDIRLAAYPYRFQVLAVDNGVATMSTPRNVHAPGPRFLAMAFPDLTDVPTDDPRMQAAFAELKSIQEYASSLVAADPAIHLVRWQLDEEWYSRRGIVAAP